ncbi:MAG: CPBP family intramembrane glutamic endopeptidase [Acidimicrobiia bacterium]
MKSRDLVATAVTLAWGAVSHRFIPERARPVAGAGAALGLAAVARGLGADARDLGCDRRDLPAGLRVGAVAAGVIVAATAAGRSLDRQGRAFRDARVTNASRTEAAVHLLVRIPFATALVEELVFRGVILGFGLRDGDRRRALLVSSIGFGLWHVGSALHPERQLASGDVVGHRIATTPAVVVGDVVATAIGGLGFGWLRLKSGSIAAPAIAHAALNASAYVATRLGMPQT